MASKQLPWWKKKTRLWLIIGILLVTAFFIAISWISGTGLNGYTTITTATTIHGVTQTTTYQQGKTLWDWLQLLIVPAVLAGVALRFNHAQHRNELRATEQRAMLERSIADDNQREIALQSYLDRLSKLLLEGNKLRESNPGDEVRTIARALTLTTLKKLDGVRKVSLLLFLYELFLIKKGPDNIIDLWGADLSGIEHAIIFPEANLRGIILSTDEEPATLIWSNLKGADLSEARLAMAILPNAKLSNAILRKAILSQADLRGADLQEADLEGASLCFVTHIPQF